MLNRYSCAQIAAISTPSPRKFRLKLVNFQKFEILKNRFETLNGRESLPNELKTIGLTCQYVECTEEHSQRSLGSIRIGERTQLQNNRT